MATGFAHIDPQTGSAAADDGPTFWFDENGRMATGWRVIGGRKYYFLPLRHDGHEP